MRALRLTHRTRWTVLVALVLAVLLPSVSHALRLARGEQLPWTQVCSASGGSRLLVRLGDDEPSRSVAGEHAERACALCALQHDLAAPPPVAVTQAAATPRVAARLQPPPDSAPPPAPAWRQAPPRGPPALF